MARMEAMTGRIPHTRTSNVGVSGLLTFMKMEIKTRIKRPPTIDNHPNQKSLPTSDHHSPDHTVTLALVLLRVPTPNAYVLPETSQASPNLLIRPVKESQGMYRL